MNLYCLDFANRGGYTFGMKTAISIPNEIFQAAEQHAQHVGKSRSQLFTEAMVEYLERHTPDEITRLLNETIATIDPGDDPFISKASHNILGQSEW